MRTVLRFVIPFVIIVLASGCSSGVTVLKEPVEPRFSASKVFVHTDTTIDLPGEEKVPAVIGVPIQSERFTLSDFDSLLAAALTRCGFVIVASQSEADLVMLIRSGDWRIDIWKATDFRGGVPQTTEIPCLSGATFRATFLDKEGNEVCVIEKEVSFREGDPHSDSDRAPWGAARRFAEYARKAFGAR